MGNEVCDYNERDGWPDELIAAHWRMRYAIVYGNLLKQKATEAGLLTDPVTLEKIKEAERQAQKATQTYKRIFERWKANGRY